METIIRKRNMMTGETEKYTYVNELSSFENLITSIIEIVFKSGNVLDETLRNKAKKGIRKAKFEYFYQVSEDVYLFVPLG